MQKKTFEEQGKAYAGELAVKNLTDLKQILRWNVRHGIFFYRVTSDLIPWNLEYDIETLPQYSRITELAADCGNIIEQNGVRLTFHPSHYCKLASTSTDTAQRSLRDVENHAKWLDLFSVDESPYYSINVHIGATYGDKEQTAMRFCSRIDDLSQSAQARLTVENDDKDSLFGVPELVSQVSEECGVPTTFDYHHHKFTSRGLTYQEAFEKASTTWDVTPVVHLSESARLHTGNSVKPQKHSKYVHYIPDWLRDADCDIMLEANAKEKAILAARHNVQD